jgi:tetratricopeptide (TPR) repeat protein
MSDLRRARAAALAGKHSGAIHKDDALYYLRLLRSSHTASPVEVYFLTRKLLEAGPSAIGKEADLWTVREDHAIACLQLGKSSEALAIVNQVAQRFPRSCRAARLKGMYLESTGKAADALETYEAALQADPENLMIIHRIAAMKKGRGDVAGALDNLHKSLSVQLGDYQAWYEAGKLHAQQGAYSKAIFCFEEVLMHQPGDLQTQLILADCLYACGGDGNILAAKKYYASVVEMSGGANVKALLGICQCDARGTDARGTDGGKGGDEASTEACLGALVADTLLSEYATNSPAWAGAMSRVLSSA